jgi:hypothetical protein
MVCAPRSDTACTLAARRSFSIEQRNAQNISQSQNDLRGRNTASTQERFRNRENFLQEAILEEYGAYNLYQYITKIILMENRSKTSCNPS